MGTRFRTGLIHLRRGDDDCSVRRRVAREAEPTPSPQPPDRHTLLLRQQRLFGNAHVARLIQRTRTHSGETIAPVTIARSPIPASPAELTGKAKTAETDPRVTLALAGVPLKKAPPGGMQFIADQSGPIGLGGKPAGYTAIKSAAAFAAPSFVTKMSAEKDGYKRRYFVEVQPTSATDVTHASYYPAPGTHDNAVSEQKDGTYRYYWTISEKISELIRAGEQEHLNDAQRAFDLTYGLIAREINAMTKERFGPADTPQAAEKMAEAELARRLPAALGTDPANWFNVLEAMLDMTLKRDRGHLHDVIPGKPVERGKTFYFPLKETDQTSIDQVGSDQIVDYPSAGRGSAGTASEQHTHPSG